MTRKKVHGAALPSYISECAREGRDQNGRNRCTGSTFTPKGLEIEDTAVEAHMQIFDRRWRIVVCTDPTRQVRDR